MAPQFWSDRESPVERYTQALCPHCNSNTFYVGFSKAGTQLVCANCHRYVDTPVPGGKE